ncbi:MAG: PAS domain-containing sensor histidine kinase, partial [bacterium]
YASDLNNDSIDKIFLINPSLDLHGSGRLLGYVRIQTIDDKIIEQVNFPGIITRPLHFLDWDRDGIKEILVPYILNDSLYVSFINAQGEKLFGFFLVEGQPRIEDNAEIPWDPNVQYFYLSDADGDGFDDLVTVIITGYARLPRGVLIHSLPEGKLLGKKIIGAVPWTGHFGDFNGDGEIEFLAATTAPNNGASAGGFDDQHTYLINFNLSLPPKITWARTMGSVWTDAHLFYHDFNEDTKKDFLVYSNSGSNLAQKARFEFVEPGSWKTYKLHVVNEPLRDLAVADLNHDLRPEFITIHANGEIWILNQELEVVKQRKVAKQLRHLKIIPDLDADGIDEIIVSTAEQGFVLSSNLDVKALLPEYRYLYIVQTGIGKTPLLLATTPDASNASVNSYLLRLNKNRFYLWHRYGPKTLWILGIATTLAASIFFVFILRRGKLLKDVQSLTFETDERGLMVLRSDGSILFTNASLFRLIGQPDSQHIKGRDFREIVGHGKVTSFLCEATQTPYHHHEAIMMLDSSQPDQTIRIVVMPLSFKGQSKPFWLVILSDKSLEGELSKAKTWKIMAQRIAHDIKNPLTSILMTLERLQKEYLQHSKERAADYDNYTTKMIEHIESLRRMSLNFMKFVDIEQLNLKKIDLNEFVKQASDKIRRNLPDDITLKLNLGSKSLKLRVDCEQMHELLENLVSNSINAMPEGGKITFTTHFDQNLILQTFDGQPRDYAIMEIRDTGCGIPESDLDHLFDPNFTATDGGTGLGLAIVKKIVDEHKGRIEVTSKQGEGTAFFVYLPIK